MDRLHFFGAMPNDDDLLKRALAKTDAEMRADLVRSIRLLRSRIAEGGTGEQLGARREELAAAERALDRLNRRPRQ